MQAFSLNHVFPTVKQIFQAAGDTSSVTLQSIKDCLHLRSGDSFFLIIVYLYGSYQRYCSLEKEWLDMPKGLCAKSIEKNQQTYRCDDCGRQTNYHIYCGSCFETGFLKGLHKGHRYKSKMERSGCCDCGDVNAIEPTGYCPNHNGVAKCDKQLDEDIERKLREVINLGFNTLFEYAEIKFFSIGLISSQSNQKLQQQIFIPQIQFHIKNIISVLLHFITVECKQKLPLQFTISKIFLEEINSERRHTCKQTQFMKTFLKRPRHLCKDSIAGLIFKYTIALDSYEKDISSIVYSLFVNEEYKLRLSEVYLENFKFLFIIEDMDETMPYIKGSDMYLIYCQFFGDKYTNKLITSPDFQNVIDQMKLGIQKLNGDHYQEIYRNVLFFFQMFLRLKSVCEQQKQESLALKLIAYNVEICQFTNEKLAGSFNHHKIKIFFIGYLLEIVLQLISVIKYEEKDAILYQNKIIQGYLLNNELMEEERSNENYDIGFGWYCLPDLIIGTLLTHYYSHFGKEEVLRLFEEIDTDGSITQRYLSRIVKSQVAAYQISKSNEVGFPGQYPPKQLYKIFYKQPSRFVYDSTISVLQVLAVCVPHHLMEVISQQPIEFGFQLISDIMTQESCLINIASKTLIKNKLIDNSLKLQMINIINLRNRSTFKDLKTTFVNNMFAETVSFNSVLEQISTYDSKKETYSIREDYKDITESLLVKRCDDYYSNIFEQENIEVKLFNKNTLFSYQMERGLETLCVLATKSLCGSKQFVEYLEELISYVWNFKSSIQNYEMIVVISLLYKRNAGNEFIEKAFKHLLSLAPQTRLQTILIQVLTKLTTQTPKKEQQTIKSAPANKVNRMKAQLQKFKKKQEQFIQNNQDLVETIKQDNLQNNQEEKQGETVFCLICHRVETNDDEKYPGFVMFIKPTVVGEMKGETYLSCGHTFHKKCLLYPFKKSQCPVCKHPFNNLFSIPSMNQMVFLSRENKNHFSHTEKAKSNFFIDLQPAQKLTGPEIQDSSDNEPLPVSYNFIDLITFKTYFSIIQSCTKFNQQQLKQLRCLYSSVMSDKLHPDNTQFMLQNKKLIDSIQITPSSRIPNIILILKYLYTFPFSKDSFEVRERFQSIIYILYTKYFVCNFICFLNGEILKEEDIDTQLKIYEDAIKAQMNQFCKGVIFAYSVIFDDPRNQILKTIENEDNLAEVLLKIYPEFFKLDMKLLYQDVKRYGNHPSFSGKTYESLIPIPKVVEIPDNYMDLHLRYNDLKCDDCEGIIRIADDESWMCLKCGYKACLMRCSKNPNAMVYSSMLHHFDTAHNGESIFIDLNSSLVYTYDNHHIYFYAFIYRDKFGEYNSDQIKNWKSLELNHSSWSKLLQLVRKRSTHIYSIQNNYRMKK